jgi:hypothetical protein
MALCFESGDIRGKVKAGKGVKFGCQKETLAFEEESDFGH